LAETESVFDNKINIEDDRNRMQKIEDVTGWENG
jgi:hypothetical protein